jgi:pimeloyl-ACP methyl ester carboxylesterase
MSDKYTNLQMNSTNVRINKLTSLFTRITFSFFWLVAQKQLREFIRKNFFAPRLYKPSEPELELLNQAETFRIMVNDQHVSCWRWGTGPAIVYVHGWNGRGIQFYFFIKEALAKGYSVVTFDGPGHGESGGNSCSYFEMSDALRGILNYCKKDDIIAVVGHSFGGAAIVNALHKDKHQVPAVLLAPALEIKDMLYTVFSTHGVPAKIVQTFIGEYEERFGYNLVKDNPNNLLADYHLNALIIHDRQDKVTSFSDSERAAKKYQSISLSATNGLGHKKVMTDPHVVTETLKYIQSRYAKAL